MLGLAREETDSLCTTVVWLMNGSEGNRLQRISLAFLALFGLGVLLHMTKSFMVPFVLAILFAYLLIPVAEFLVKIRVPRIVASAVVFLSFSVLLVGLLFLIYGAMSSAASSLPQYMDRYSEYLNKFSNFVQAQLDIELFEGYEQVGVEAVLSLISPSAVMKTVNQGIGTAIDFISRLFLMMLFLLFLLAGRRAFIDKVLQFLHAHGAESEGRMEVLQSITRQIQTYLFMKTIISLVTGLVFGLVAVLFGLDFALIWGVLAVLLNFIPTIGPVIASIPPILFAFLQFESVWYAVVASICLSAVQFASGSFVEPLVMGDRLNLNIIAILLSLLLWGLIWGIPGMFLAVPITAALNIIFSHIPSLRDASILLSK
jgi:AI-2 transport protein TqsA